MQPSSSRGRLRAFLVAALVGSVLAAWATASSFGTRAEASPSGGTFLVENYATGTGTGGYFKRGYIFEVSQTTVVTGLTGAGTNGGTFVVGLYEATTTANLSGGLYDGGSARPTSLLGSITFSGTEANGSDVTKNLSSSVTLQPGQLYLLAQMLTSGSGSHATVTGLNRSDILSHPRIARWGPTTGVYRWSSASSATSFVDRDSSDINDLLPRLGLAFQSDCQLPTVVTDSVSITGDQITFSGTLTGTGASGSGCPNPAVELAFERGTQPDVGVTGTFSNATPSNTSASPTSFSFTLSGLTANTTYYFRAVAINEAGRSTGTLLSFTYTPEPSVGAVTVTTVGSTSASLSATLLSPGTSAVTSRDFCVATSPGGACSLIVPAGADFTASVTGLVPGTTYHVRARATNSTGTGTGPEQSFTTLQTQAITFPQPPDLTYAGGAALTPLASPPTSDRGLPVQLASTTPGTCTVDGTSVITQGVGQCMLRATQDGDSATLAATAVEVELQILPRPVSLVGTRTYDGTSTVDAGVLTVASGLVGSEELTLTGAGTLDGAGVGDGRTLDVAGVSLANGSGGGLAANYTLEGGSHTVDVTPRPVRGAFTVASRAYDGTDVLDDTLVLTRTLGPVAGTLASDVIPGDVDAVTLTGGTATLATADADEATPTAVTLTGATLTGSAAGNYVLDGIDTTTVTITRRPLTVTGATVASREYDGSDVVAVTGATLDGVVGSEDVTLTGTTSGTAASRNAGTHAVTTTMGLDGADVANYVLTQPSLSVTILPRPVSLAGTRTYDGTSTVDGGVLTVASGLVGSEELALTGAGTLDGAGVGDGRTLDVAGTLDVTGITLADGSGGGLAANYTLTGGTHTVDVTPRPVRGAFTVASRPYDGTTVLGDTLVLTRTLGPVAGTPASGVIPGDAVTLTGGTATLASAAADEAAPTAVTLLGATLTGSAAANYVLDGIDTTTVTITRRPLTVTGAFGATSRPYDGTATASIASSSLTLSGVVAGDSVSLVPVAAFPSMAVGQGRTVRLTGGSTLSGAAAANYRLDLTGAPTATANVTRRVLTVGSGSFTVAGKVYDGTDGATVTGSTMTLSGFAPGDVASDVTWTPTARFRSAAAGTRTAELVGGDVLGGAKGANYTLRVIGAPTATATIAQRPVTITGATATTRPYDGTTTVALTGATLTGIVPGDTVSLTNATAGTASSRDAGTRSVTTTMGLTGTAAANYRIAAQPALSVTITPLPLDVTMNALPARTYDAAATLPLAAGAFTVSGVLPGESIDVSGTGRLSSRAAGTRTVTLDGPTFTPATGTTLTNYVLPQAVTGTVTVTRAPLRIEGATVTSRPFDDTTAATVTGATLAGVRAGDNVSLTGATTGTFASGLPGTHTVTYAPTLVGVDAASYTLVVPELTGTITPAAATLRVTGGLTQFADGSPRTLRAAVSPAGVGTLTITYPGGTPPTTVGSHTVTITLDSATHIATPLTATLTIEPIDALLLPGLTSNGNGTSGTGTNGTNVNGGNGNGEVDEAAAEARREALLARIAVRPDSTLALPEIGPVLEEDGTAPALAPRTHRLLADGEPSEARVVVVEERRVRVETGDESLALELQATISTPEGRVPLPVDADGTLLLDRGGFVEVGGTGFAPGSTAEVWMFSEATFLGTAIVGPDGSFEGAFLIDDDLTSGEHTLQLNGTGADQKVRSTSLGIRIEDPENPTRERIVLATEPSGSITTTLTSPLWLALLAAILGSAITARTLTRRRREDPTTAR